MKKFVFVLAALSAGFAAAQDCSTGTCQRPVRSVVAAAATPVVVVTEAVVGVAEQTVQFAACSTRKAVAVTTQPAKRVFSRRTRCCR